MDDNQNMVKAPFRSYVLDEDKPDPTKVGTIFTVRLNAQEWGQLQQDMKDFNIPNKGAMLKFLAKTGRNVLHGTFGVPTIRWLFSSKRVKEDE
jgi:hypothetical protein